MCVLQWTPSLGQINNKTKHCTHCQKPIDENLLEEVNSTFHRIRKCKLIYNERCIGKIRDYEDTNTNTNKKRKRKRKRKTNTNTKYILINRVRVCVRLCVRVVCKRVRVCVCRCGWVCVDGVCWPCFC